MAGSAPPLTEVAITGVAVVMIIRKRRNAGKTQVLKRPAHELAYEALDQLVEEDLISRGKIKLFNTGAFASSAGPCYTQDKEIVECVHRASFVLHN